MTIDHSAGEPLYQQLAGILRSRIMSGELPPGRLLPSALNLAQTYEVSRGTVVKATRILQDEGLLRSTLGRGVYVAPKQDWGPAPRGVQ